MPNPNWMPLIGSGFDDLARQRQWAVGRNDSVEAQNLARAAESQKTQNSYLQTLAANQQQEIDRQAASQQRADEVAQGTAQQTAQSAEEKRRYDAQTVEQKRQFGISQTFADKQLATQKEEADAKQKFFEAQQAAKAEATGQALAHGYASAKRAKEDLESQVQVNQTAIETAQAELAALRIKKKPTPAETLRSSELPAEIKQLTIQGKHITSAKAQAEHVFYNHLDKLTGDFTLDENSGEVIHTPSGKKWKISDATAVPPAPMTGGDASVSITGPQFNWPGSSGFPASGGDLTVAGGAAPAPPTTGTGTNSTAPSWLPGQSAPATTLGQLGIGDLLGAPSSGAEFANAEEVRAAFKAGKLSLGKATEILSQRFGMALK
jgi:hypothetical protein